MSGVIRVTIAQATVADFRRVQTRTGRPMVRFRAEIGKDRLSVVAFNDLAEHLDLADGNVVDITGRLQGTSWEGQVLGHHQHHRPIPCGGHEQTDGDEPWTLTAD